jgi:hypothetical protein
MKKLMAWVWVGLLTIGFLTIVIPGQASAETRGTGAGSRDTTNGCIFLDPDVDVQYVVNGFTYNTYGSQWNDNKSHWEITDVKGWSYESVIYPGNTYPGQPMLDNAHANYDGWMYVRVGMESPPVDLVGSYDLELWTWITYPGADDPTQKAWMTAIVDSVECPISTYYNSSTNYDFPTDNIYTTASGGGRGWLGQVGDSPFTGQPWTAADFVNDWQVWMEFDYDVVETPIRLNYIYAVLVPTTGPVEVGGQQCLYPDGDLVVEGWESIPASNDLFDMVNETSSFGDAETTYVASETLADLLGFSMEDPSIDWYEFTSFNLTLWVIARSSETNALDRALTVGLVSGYGYDRLDMRTAYVGGYWGNHSFSFPVNMKTDQPWTFDELNDTTVWIEAAGNMTITQVGMIVTDVFWIAPNEVGPQRWLKFDLVSQGGIIALFGFIGFFGMIATPAISYLQYKSGEEPLLSAAHGIWLMVLFFGLFLIGLMAS